MPTNGYFNSTYTVDDAGVLLSPPAQERGARPDSGSFVIPATPEVRVGGDDQTFAEAHPLPAGDRFAFNLRAGIPFLITDTGQTVDVDVLWSGVN